MRQLTAVKTVQNAKFHLQAASRDAGVDSLRQLEI